MKITIRILYILFFGVLITSFYFCANIVAPQGGPKDEIPPGLDTLNSTPNYQTNYTNSPIIRTYDEWIQLKDAVTQVVVSPPLEYLLDIKLKKKSVFVNFHEEEVLKENTTYTINFGEAIQDFTEGNVPPQSRYVFSTGPVIDSLTFQAKLVDINTKEAIADALLMLYVNQSDTVLYTTKPFYFAKSDTGGIARIENIRKDNFKVVALTDANLNYQLDGETEMLHFLLDPIALNKDTTLGVLEMYIPEQDLVRRGMKSSYGKTTVLFNRQPYDLQYEVIGDPPSFDLIETAGDSLMFWYRDTTITAWSIVIQNDTTLLDTIEVNMKSVVKGKVKGILDSKTKRKSLSFNSDSTLTYRWNRPIGAIDESKMMLGKDSLANTIRIEYSIDEEDPYLLKARGNWEHPATYVWQADKGAITDIFDTPSDSLGMVEVDARDDKAYGAVKINFSALRLDQPYLVQLIGLRAKNVIRDISFVADSTGLQSIDMTLLDPGNYAIRLIEDDNTNGRWDTGNYKRQQLPERIFIQEMPPLKANWEQSIDFKL